MVLQIMNHILQLWVVKLKIFLLILKNYVHICVEILETSDIVYVGSEFLDIDDRIKKVIFNVFKDEDLRIYHALSYS